MNTSMLHRINVILRRASSMFLLLEIHPLLKEVGLDQEIIAFTSAGTRYLLGQYRQPSNLLDPQMGHEVGLAIPYVENDDYVWLWNKVHETYRIGFSDTI